MFFFSLCHSSSFFVSSFFFVTTDLHIVLFVSESGCNNCRMIHNPKTCNWIHIRTTRILSHAMSSCFNLFKDFQIDDTTERMYSNFVEYILGKELERLHAGLIGKGDLGF